jgi:transposase-like protein
MGAATSAAPSFEIAKNKQKCPYCGAFNDFIPVDGMEMEITKSKAE